MIIPSTLLAKCWDRIRLIAIENMKGAFGNEGALRFLLGDRRPKLGLFAEEWQNLFDECVGCDSVLLAQDWNCAMLDELIGPTDAHHRRVDHLRMEMFHHGAAKAVVQNMVFNRADDLDAACKKFEGAGVHRLDPARVYERDRDSFFFELARRFFGDFKHVAQSEDRHVTPMLHDLRLTYLEKLRF